MRIKKILVCLLLLSLVLAGCVPEDLPTRMMSPGPEASYAELPVSIDLSMGHPAGTKAPVLSGADDERRSGVLFLVFRSATGQLDSYRFFTPAELAAASTTPLKLRVPLVDCDFYVLGNLMAVRRSDGAAANLMDALGDDFPVDEALLEALEYRLDGGALNGIWRRETMEEVRQYGIPFSCVERNVNVRNLIAQGRSVPQSQPVWMFAKVVVKIDHAAFDGGDPAKLGFFTNKTFRIRQANLKLLPFSDRPVKAQEAADSGEGDRDPSMTNAGAGEFVFFVPENMQGEAPASAFAAEPDAARKSRLKVPSNTGIPAGCRDYGSYVEFTGTLDRDAGGFGGNVTYQFYLGANETTDFNLRRGRKYQILLRFTTDGLFHPDWRVQPDLTDSRKFWITADEACTTDIGTVNATRTLAVRKSRPGRFYLYMNPTNLGQTNYLKGKAHEKPGDFVMDDMADCAWFANLMVPGTEDYNWLANRGITASWDAASARLTFAVTDPAKFGAATLGETREFAVKLLPDVGGALESRFKIKLVDDLVLKVADGKSLSDEFYLGQKRTVTVTGFSGTDIRYAAIQPDCGPKTGNQMWKAGNSATAVFPTVAGSAASPVLDSANATYANQKMTGSLDIYAWYPNKFQSSHGWTSKPGKIVIFSEDYLNDSLEADIVISEPRWVPWTDINGTSGSKVELNIDGAVKPMKCLYKTFNGSAELKKADFDPVLYDALLKVSMVPAQTISGKEYLASAMGADADGGIFIERTLIDGHKLEEEDYNDMYCNHYLYGDRYGLKMGKVRLQANPATGLFANNTFDIEVKGFKMLFRSGVFNNSDTHSYHHQSGGGAGYVSSYFQLYDDGSGNEKIAPQDFKVSYDFRAGDKSRLQFSLTGNKITFTSAAGHEFGPKIDFSADDTHVHWLFDPEAQVKFDGSEAIPGELLVPYGDQVFTVKYENQWDHREFTNEFAFNLMYDTGVLVPMYTFTTSTCKIYIASHRGAKLLATRGTQMTHAGRLFCLKVCGVDVNNYLEYRIAFHDAAVTSLPTNQRGAFSYGVDGTSSFGNKQYKKIQDDGFMIPSTVYRGSGFSSWTKNSAEDFIWSVYPSPAGYMGGEKAVFRYGLLNDVYSRYKSDNSGATTQQGWRQYLAGGSTLLDGHLFVGSEFGYGDRIDMVDGSFSGAVLKYWQPSSWLRNWRGVLWMGSTAF